MSSVAVEDIDCDGGRSRVVEPLHPIATAPPKPDREEAQWAMIIPHSPSAFVAHLVCDGSAYQKYRRAADVEAAFDLEVADDRRFAIVKDAYADRYADWVEGARLPPGAGHPNGFNGWVRAEDFEAAGGPEARVATIISVLPSAERLAGAVYERYKVRFDCASGGFSIEQLTTHDKDADVLDVEQMPVAEASVPSQPIAGLGRSVCGGSVPAEARKVSGVLDLLDAARGK